MQSYQHKEFIGTILPPFDLERKRQTKGGWFVDFSLESANGKVIPCRVFQEVFEAAGDVIKAGSKVALFGYLAGEQLRVKVARTPDAPAVKKYQPQTPSAKEEARADFAARVKYMARLGSVPVEERGAIQWYPLAYTMKVDGKRVLKVEFAMSRLGPKYVTDKLRAKQFISVGESKIVMSGNLKHRYLEILEELVKEARDVDATEF